MKKVIPFLGIALLLYMATSTIIFFWAQHALLMDPRDARALALILASIQGIINTFVEFA